MASPVKTSLKAIAVFPEDQFSCGGRFPGCPFQRFFPLSRIHGGNWSKQGFQRSGHVHDGTTVIWRLLNSWASRSARKASNDVCGGKPVTRSALAFR
jgi:hypothetical protein